jgi:hypothetical protein
MEILILVAALFLGMWIRGRSQSEMAAEEEEPDSILCRVEWIGNQCYLFREDTDEFLGQGNDLEQIVAGLDQRGVAGSYLIPKEMVTRPQQIQP